MIQLLDLLPLTFPKGRGKAEDVVADKDDQSLTGDSITKAGEVLLTSVIPALTPRSIPCRTSINHREQILRINLVAGFDE